MKFDYYWRTSRLNRCRLTTFGRSLLLIVVELLANAACWAVAAILFRKANSVLGLAMLAWTLGLRHALDADHISAIDNATRALINLGQTPVTCGLFFSLGHSTIVVVVNIAIAVSLDVYEHINGVGEIGGIVGASISGSFLFLVGLVNSIFLVRIIMHRRRERTRSHQVEVGDLDEGQAHDVEPKQGMIMTRILGPVINFVDRPWKMYIVGVLFGFGFDTASSIALLAITAVAKKKQDGSSIPSSYIVILPLLFTAGMTLVDSLDSILMLYSYTDFAECTLKLVTQNPSFPPVDHAIPELNQDEVAEASNTRAAQEEDPLGVGDLSTDKSALEPATVSPVVRSPRRPVTISGLSIVLTFISILLAYSISIITIMGLVGEQCTSCREAAEAEDGHGGGLAGRWWRAWAKANDQSGYIGAAIVGAFIFIVAGWYAGRWIIQRLKIKGEHGGE